MVLPGERGREARARAALYLAGPLDAEAALPSLPTADALPAVDEVQTCP